MRCPNIYRVGPWLTPWHDRYRDPRGSPRAADVLQLRVEDLQLYSSDLEVENWTQTD